jgi:hypothetical protein
MTSVASDADPPLHDGEVPPPIPDASQGAVELGLAGRRRADIALFESGGASTIGTPTNNSRRGAFSLFGFLFPVVWFLYKKMYLQASVVVLLPVTLSLVHAPNVIVRGIGLFISLFGAFGPRFYASKARRMTAEIRATAPDDATAEWTIARAGGVSTAGAVLGALVTICALMIAFVKR